MPEPSVKIADMVRIPLTPAMLAAAFTLALAFSAASQAVQTNTSVFPELPFAVSVNREVDLMRPLLAETNKSFDLKVCASVSELAKKPMVISYRLVSVIFYYPKNVVFYPGPYTEMDQPDELVCTEAGVTRRATTNEVSANCVRVLDVHRKDVGAELNLFLGVTALEHPEEAKYVHRSFRYIYQDGWKEDKMIISPNLNDK